MRQVQPPIVVPHSPTIPAAFAAFSKSSRSVIAASSNGRRSAAPQPCPRSSEPTGERRSPARSRTWLQRRLQSAPRWGSSQGSLRSSSRRGVSSPHLLQVGCLAEAPVFRAVGRLCRRLFGLACPTNTRNLPDGLRNQLGMSPGRQLVNAGRFDDPLSPQLLDGVVHSLDGDAEALRNFLPRDGGFRVFHEDPADLAPKTVADAADS